MPTFLAALSMTSLGLTTIIRYLSVGTPQCTLSATDFLHLEQNLYSCASVPQAKQDLLKTGILHLGHLKVGNDVLTFPREYESIIFLMRPPSSPHGNRTCGLPFISLLSAFSGLPILSPTRVGPFSLNFTPESLDIASTTFFDSRTVFNLSSALDFPSHPTVNINAFFSSPDTETSLPEPSRLCGMQSFSSAFLERISTRSTPSFSSALKTASTRLHSSSEDKSCQK